MKRVAQEFVADIDITTLSEHPENPRRGNDSAVAESVEHNGFFGAVLVQKSTGYVLAGNTRLRVARADGEPTLPGFLLDVDDDEARRILLADNRMSDLAFYDDSDLVTLLANLADQEDGLLGTGYTTDQLALMLDAQDDILDVEDESSELDGTEDHVIARIELSPDVLRLWSDHRSQYDSDDAAMAALLT
jgi:ParB-like chromosome segregation protein Spo0J